MSTFAPEVKMDLQVERMSAAHHLKGEVLSRLNGVSDSSESSGILNLSCGGGNSGEDSSGDERHLMAVHPKKNRLKEPNNTLNLCNGTNGLIHNKETLNNINSNNHNHDSMVDDEDVDIEDEEDEMVHKECRIANFTSGENSDDGADGDESMGSKQDEPKKMFECDVCNMQFSNGANMRRHRMRHTGVKPYECRVCQKRFFRKDHLTEHMATHKLHPFRCPICNKGFQRQIAMRAHFQNEHVGGSTDMVKACPLCSYKAGSMKSLRVHFYSRHGIDLDNPIPIPNSPGGPSSSPVPTSGEYSELAHALGFDDREKSNDSSSVIPSHFLVPHIEISSNSPYPPHFPFTADSNYNFAQDADGPNGRSSPANISPQSNDSGSSNIPSSSDHIVIIKKEITEDAEDLHKREAIRVSNGKLDSSSDDVQDLPEDLSSASGNSLSSCQQSPNSSKCSSSSLIKVSPLKTLLGEEWRSNKDGPSSTGGRTNGNSSSSSTSSTSSSTTRNRENHKSFAESFELNGIETEASHSPMFSNRKVLLSSLHCVFCGHNMTLVGAKFPLSSLHCVYCGRNMTLVGVKCQWVTL